MVHHFNSGKTRQVTMVEQRVEASVRKKAEALAAAKAEVAAVESQIRAEESSESRNDFQIIIHHYI